MHVLSAAASDLLLLLLFWLFVLQVCLLAETIQVPQSLSFVSHQGKPAFAKSLLLVVDVVSEFQILHLILVLVPIAVNSVMQFFKGFKMLGFKVFRV